MGAELFLVIEFEIVLSIFGLWARRVNKSKGEGVVNDSPVVIPHSVGKCRRATKGTGRLAWQSHRADRSIFSAEKIQDRWFKLGLRKRKIKRRKRSSKRSLRDKDSSRRENRHFVSLE